MAVRGTASVNSQKISRGFTTALASAVLEWLLIFLLFIIAIFSYLVTIFSRYCELQVPCLLCSRLDHVFGNEKLGYYWDLICSNHKLEISSLVLCHVHNKLVDVYGMCETCLFSFATINKSNAETYRLLVGKLGEDPTLDLDQGPLLEGHNLGSSSTRHCSCCNEPWNSRGYAQKLLQTRSIGSEAAELDLPLSGAIVDDQSDLKKRREIPSGSVKASHLGSKEFDPLSHIGYTELKITSDTESEVLISVDDGDASVLDHGTDDPDKDFSVKCVPVEPHVITLADDFASEKLIHPASEPEPSHLVTQVQSDIIEPYDGTSVASTIAIGHGLEELNWQQVEHKADPSSLTELISLDDVSPSSNATETPVQESKESYATKTGKVGQTSVIESGEISKAGNGPITTTKIGLETKSETGLQMPNYLELGDAYKIAVGNRGRQLSGVLAEQWNVKDSSRASEDLKLLLSQISAIRGIELSLNDMSPRVSGNIDELKTPDASSSIGVQILQKRISLERNESGLESLDGSIVSEIEGESVVDRLKRQIEHDRKSMNALYKELEEERNASAVSANQAMAMITRLQEEKAALHMDALQYLRMMEEQAEYDMEALQKSNELLAQKEKEIQDLEVELEFYRRKFPNESMLENIVEPTCDLKVRDMRVELSQASSFKDSESVARNSVAEKPNICHKIEGADTVFGDRSTITLKNSLLEFEDERLYISECLKKLEKKLHLFSNNGVDLANGEYSGNEGDGISDLKELNHKVGSQENSETEENDLSIQNDVFAIKESVRSQEGCIPSFENPQIVSEENSELDCGGKCSSMVGRETDLVALGNEFSVLNNRLEALEADQNFLEHTINSLRNGDKGLHFIQEIASHLRELQRMGITKRDQAFA